MPDNAALSFASFGSMLKHLRRRARLTQKELGIAVGYSEAHVARLENGQRLPDLTTVRSLLVQALGLESEPALADQLVELAKAARGETIPSVIAANSMPVFGRSPSQPANLPVQLTSFIGRERELAEVKALLSEMRLLTITGSAGAGKSRLAVQLAGELLSAYADGIRLVELAPLTNPELLADTVAAACGLTPGSRSALDVLIGNLHEREMLLILDDCEHLIGPCAGLAESLLRACPELHILATSREALKIPGETVWQLPELTLDEALQVFAERARSSRPGFAINADNAAVVERICEQLDRIPLAIEMAVSRLKAMSLDDIAAHLDDRFQLLAGATRTATPRHQTLRMLVDWSYDLLQLPERYLLERLSVFAGGWTLELAEAVCADQPGSIQQPGNLPVADILPLLIELVGKSLVLVDESGAGTRYRLIETIRTYASKKLDDSESHALNGTRRRHAEAFITLACAAIPQLDGRDQGLWVQRLLHEQGNFRAALDWSLSGTGDINLGLRLAGALWRLWLWYGPIREGHWWTDELIKRMPPDAAPEVRARLLLGSSASALEMIGGDLADHDPVQLEKQLTEVYALFDRLRDQTGLAETLIYLATVAWNQRDIARAQSLGEHSLAIARRIGCASIEGRALEGQGNLAVWLGDLARAESLFEQCLVVERGSENGRGIARALFGLGLTALRRLDFARAIELNRQGLQMAGEVGYRRACIQGLMALGEAQRYLGDTAQALSAFEEMLAQSQALDEPYGVGFALQLMGKVARDQGQAQTAQKLFTNSLIYRREMGAWSIPYNLEGLASVALAQQQIVRAARLFGAAEAIRENLHWPLTADNTVEYERWLASLRAQLTPQALCAAWAEGRAMSLENAIEAALAGAYGGLPKVFPVHRPASETGGQPPPVVTPSHDRPPTAWYSGLSAQWRQANRH